MAAHHPSQGNEASSALNTTPPVTLPAAEEEQVAALMALSKNLTSAGLKELQRRLREHHNTHSILFRIPAELRNRIFEMAFLDDLTANELKKATLGRCWRDRPSTMKSTMPETYEDLKNLIYGPKSVNACRQMRYECRSLLELDNIEMTVYILGRKVSGVFSPMALDQSLTVGMFFWVHVHESSQIAHYYGRDYWGSRGSIAHGMVCFPPNTGIKPRSFCVEPAGSYPHPGSLHLDHQLKSPTTSE